MIVSAVRSVRPCRLVSSKFSASMRASSGHLRKIQMAVPDCGSPKAYLRPDHHACQGPATTLLHPCVWEKETAAFQQPLCLQAAHPWPRVTHMNGLVKRTAIDPNKALPGSFKISANKDIAGSLNHLFNNPAPLTAGAASGCQANEHFVPV